MFDIKIIFTLAIIVFLFIGCEESTNVADSKSVTQNTLNDSSLDQNVQPISDYFYNFDEGIEAQYFFYNAYITGGGSTISNPTLLDPFSDTLNFRTFPYYTVKIDGVPDTIDYMLSLTNSNYMDYSTLYPLYETNSSKHNWCNKMLVEYEGNCPETVEVSFDYAILSKDPLLLDVDTIPNPAVFIDILSTKKVSFEVVSVDIDSLVWDNSNNRYEVFTPDFPKRMSATLCTGICDTTATDSTLAPCVEADDTGCYDSTYVIRNIFNNGSEADYFDSLIYIGIIDTNRYSIEDLMFIDRTEWERFDTTYKSVDKALELDTTFIFSEIQVPKDSPLYRINGDCDQNLSWTDAEWYTDFGADWCPDSLETGSDTYTDSNEDGIWNEGEPFIDDWNGDEKWTKGFCEVVDTDSVGAPGYGEIIDEVPCNCFGDWRETIGGVANPNYEGPVTNPFWEEGSDPNGDNWRDCGLDGLCPEHPDDTNGDENGTEGNGVWDIFENFEKNGQYDFDFISGTREFFEDRGNGIIDDKEFCDMGNDDECNGIDPFEDRNCNGRWDAAESADKGNGIWDAAEVFMDLNGDGDWTENGHFGASYETNCYLPSDELEVILGLNVQDDNSDEDICKAAGCSWSLGYKTCYSDADDEPLYVPGDRLHTFIIDYTDPLKPVQVTSIDTSTSVTLFYGTLNGESRYIPHDQFLVLKEIEERRSRSFYDFDSLITIYTNKIIEYPLPGIADDYHLTKTKWYQDIGNTHYDENDLDNVGYGDNYGYNYHLFKIAENGDIVKMVHPAYFNYYGYYDDWDQIQIGSWRKELAEEEVYLYTYNGLLRDGERYFQDTTIVTPVADYNIQNLYEVSYDTSEVVPFKQKIYDDIANGLVMCIEDSLLTFDPLECLPMDTTLTNTYKITKTQTITMIGSGLELGLRNTIWLGSEGVDNPLGIVKDLLEFRWTEPYWKEDGSGWTTMSRLELRSLRKTESELSRLLGIFQPIKHLSLQNLVDEESFENDPYVINSTYGIHQLRLPYQK